MAETNGYRVGERQPVGTANGISSSRQFTDLSEGEVADLVESLVRALMKELGILAVAGAEQAHRWELAEKIRFALHRHHQVTRIRAGQA